jgi:type II secretory pathway pseudopilin PulG
MKNKRASRYLQSLLRKNQNEGLSRLELLIIVGALAMVIAIVLPVIARNREVESKKIKLHQEVETNLYSMQEAQQNYYLIQNTFTNSLKDLGISSVTQTEDYEYSVQITDKVAFQYGTSRQNDLKSYVSAVFSGTNKRTLTATILCKANSSGTNQIANPTYENGVLACGANTKELRQGKITTK